MDVNNLGMGDSPSSSVSTIGGREVEEDKVSYLSLPGCRPRPRSSFQLWSGAARRSRRRRRRGLDASTSRCEICFFLHGN